MLDISTSPEVPTGTTVARYLIDRLGKYPILRSRYNETVDDGQNVFGFEAERVAASGRSWEIFLDSSVSEQKDMMTNILGIVAFTVVKEAIIALGLTDVTDEQIVAALAQTENIDSVIATQLENLELSRRAGTLPVSVHILGDAP